MKHQHHPEDHRRMIIFVISAAIVMALSYFFITKPQMEKARQQQGVATAEVVKDASPAKIAEQGNLREINDVLGETSVPRLMIDSPEVHGTFATTGIRFDDMVLKSYYTSLKHDKPVRLLAPPNTKQSYFVEIGMMPAKEGISVPGQQTQWRVVSGENLTPEAPVILEWDNDNGLVFRRNVTIDSQYVVTVVQSVKNNSAESVTLYPYALISQTHHIPEKGEEVNFEDQPSAVQHVGPISYLNGKLHEEDYDDLRDDEKFDYPDSQGWLGVTSKYWMVALLPQKDMRFDARFTHQLGALKQDIYQADLRGQAIIVEAGQNVETEMRFFAGAKKLAVLNAYKEKLDVEQLDVAVDFGILWFLTKPLYYLLSFLGNFFSEQFGTVYSFGIALLVMTVLVRGATFPLQNKSYRSMNRMKDLGPKIHALKEKCGDDKTKFQQEVLQLYKKEKVNPAGGCVPILIQVPIFFALYKVIFITLDMRHAPFWGWIEDLSAPDPTNIFNLFGFLPWNTPAFLTIGAWPILYGLTMYIQQRLNPQPEDPVQKQIFAILPWVFMFIFAKFPAGLVIYYTWSNLLGIVQQYSLRRMHGGGPVKK